MESASLPATQNLWLWLTALSGGLLVTTKWSGAFDLLAVFALTAAVVLQAVWTPRPAAIGNPRGFSLDVILAAVLFVAATVYVLTYIPQYGFGMKLGHFIQMQGEMLEYHARFHFSSTDSSRWWKWPLLAAPVSYYNMAHLPPEYWSIHMTISIFAKLWLTGQDTLTEIMALPNPAVVWFGLISVPFVAWLAWRKQQKAHLLIIVAYLLHWLPWAFTSRTTFAYYFFPNVALICLADTILLQRIWNSSWKHTWRLAPQKLAVGAFLLLVPAAFVFWYPLLAGSLLTLGDWNTLTLKWLLGDLWNSPYEQLESHFTATFQPPELYMPQLPPPQF